MNNYYLTNLINLLFIAAIRADTPILEKKPPTTITEINLKPIILESFGVLADKTITLSKFPELQRTKAEIRKNKQRYYDYYIQDNNKQVLAVVDMTRLKLEDINFIKNEIEKNGTLQIKIKGFETIRSMGVPFPDPNLKDLNPLFPSGVTSWKVFRVFVIDSIVR